ncbi:hypothetical protein HIM_12238 [Hirsutella minnesotensis 3608]|uniref:Chromo domain-containing protein n=1 Tax=Hirsutella minnesotensis 3608 TaxID=1043627 RepID=A0A0F7ZF19_9HYPO|nr:hypothetical protein HIM_12238 [Hirsutella minnesotensis 3608]
MAITDGTDQSTVSPGPPPYDRPTKVPLLKGSDGSDGSGSDGSDSAIDTNGRQHDNPDPFGPGHFHERDTPVNEEQLSEDLAPTESEGSHGSNSHVLQARRKCKVPDDGQSGNDSIADTDMPAQHKVPDETDQTTLAGGARGNDHSGVSLASSLPDDLQCVRDYRKSAFNKGDMPYFEFHCLMRDGQWYWIAESDIQRSVPSAVGTFWGCGPEDWVAPETGGREPEREVWKRPLATDDDGVPEAFLIMCRKTSQSGHTGFLVQKVGYPAAQPTWHDEKWAKEKCIYEYERYQSYQADYRDLRDGEEPQLVAIVGHRLNGESGSQKRIQLSCQWTNDTETWEIEDEIQRKYNAAVLTYWQSDAKARRACKVPDKRLRIIGYEKTRNGG